MNLARTIHECKKGKLSAQKALYDTYKSLLFGLCMRYAENVSSAENLLHDSFLRVCREIRAYKDEEPFEAWITGMVLGTIVRQQKELIPDVPSDFTEKTENSLSRFNENAPKIPENILLDYIQELPRAHRFVFNLYHLDGLNHQEISKALSISLNSSQTYYTKALEMLSVKVLEYMSLEKEVLNE